MKFKPSRAFKRIGLTIVAITAVALATQITAPTAGAAGNSYVGRAYALELDSKLLLDRIPIHVGPVSDTGDLPAGGGFQDASLVTFANAAPPITLNALDSVTFGAGNQSTSTSTVASTSVTVGTAISVSADVIQATATALCSGVSGSASLANVQLRVLGLPVTVPLNPAPNTVLANIAGARIVLNEQITTNGTLHVNAIHVSVNAPLVGKIDLVISHARAGISCGPVVTPTTTTSSSTTTTTTTTSSSTTTTTSSSTSTSPTDPTDPTETTETTTETTEPTETTTEPPVTTTSPAGPPPPPACDVKDFVTGGGQITSGGKKITFAVHGGIDGSGNFTSANLQVNNHSTNPPGKIHSQALTGYRDPIPPSNTRELKFEGGWTVTVTDNGEPGRNDTFAISGPGLTASGTLTGGGNIQLHKPAGCQG